MGQVLESARIERNAIVVDYDTRLLSHKLYALILFFEKVQAKSRSIIRNLPTFDLRDLPYVIPGYGSSAIRKAKLVDPDELKKDVPLFSRGRQSGGEISISTFGQILRTNASDLAAGWPPSIEKETWWLLCTDIAELGPLDSCVDHPTQIEEQVYRLQGLLEPDIPPPVFRIWAGYVSIAFTTLLAGLSIPWQQLADRSTAKTASEFFVPLLFLLVCNASTCSIIAHYAIRALNDDTIANAKTLAKSTTIILAIATLLIGAGLSISQQSTGGLIITLLPYVGILLSTLAADSLVNRIDARFKRLTATTGE